MARVLPDPAVGPRRGVFIKVGGSRLQSHPDLSVGGTRQLIRQRDMNRVGIVITNHSSTVNVRLGDYAIGIAQGVRLGAGQSITLTTCDEIWAISEGAAVTLSFTEELV